MSRADLESLRAYLENLKQKYIQPLENELERIESIAKGAQGAQSFDNYSSMITKLNSLSKNSMNVGANILIVTLNVPDLWVSEIADTSAPYLYVSDEYFVNELFNDGKIQVGYFVLSPLETLKVNLTDYVKNTDLAGQSKAGVVYKAANNEIMAGRFNYYIDAYYLPFGVKYSLTNSSERDTWTDEDKAKACETIGAVQRQPNKDHGWNRVYGMDASGNELVHRVSNGIQANTIAIRGVKGVVMCGTPSGDNDATTKAYVDNLPDYLTLTDEQKAKWRAWLGIE